MQRNKVDEEQNRTNGNGKFSKKVSGYLTPEEKLKWNAAKEKQRKLEKRRELSNGEIFARLLEDGMPSRAPDAPGKKKPDPDPPRH